MAKRKITVTVDEELVERAHRLSSESLSALVNEALAAYVERLGRRAALGELLEGWAAAFGPVSAEAAAAARAAFDDLDGLSGQTGAG